VREDRMMDLGQLIDEARVLRPGDVVAVKFSRPLTRHARELARDQLDHIHGKTGVHFVLFEEDVDLQVFRPVESEND
jgi:hypothetical protein